MSCAACSLASSCWRLCHWLFQGRKSRPTTSKRSARSSSRFSPSASSATEKCGFGARPACTRSASLRSSVTSACCSAGLLSRAMRTALSALSGCFSSSATAASFCGSGRRSATATPAVRPLGELLHVGQVPVGFQRGAAGQQQRRQQAELQNGGPHRAGSCGVFARSASWARFPLDDVVVAAVLADGGVGRFPVFQLLHQGAGAHGRQRTIGNGRHRRLRGGGRGRLLLHASAPGPGWARAAPAAQKTCS